MSFLSSTFSDVLTLDPTADLIEFNETWYDRGAFRDVVETVAAQLHALGLGEDTRIGILKRNHPDPFAAIISVICMDGVIVSINSMLPDDKLNADISTLELPVVIGLRDDLERPGVLASLKASGTAVIELEPTLKGAALLDGFSQYDPSLVRMSSPGVFIEMLTSGTTGKPKRIPLKRDAYADSFKSAMSYEKGRAPEDPPKIRSGLQMVVSPLSHIGGLWGALSSFAAGRRICLLEKFSVENWCGAVVRHRPKVAGAVPAALRMILDANVPKEDLRSLVAVRTGTQPLDPATAIEFLDRYDIAVLQNYGATEFAGAVAGWSIEDFREYFRAKPDSVGRFQPGVEGRIVDADTGDALAVGEEGVLELKARQFGNNGQWLRTTDRAKIDQDGFLYILGRTDNAILRGGFKVHPDEVVSVLERHPSIREAVVVGRADRRLGAVPVAAIMLKSGMKAPADSELRAFAREHLTAYQVPVEFVVVDDVPRTTSMKPALPLVRDMLEEKLAKIA
ncbi:MAG: fatty acid--CoA ligase family protein [Pseudomonadota bacterium]